MRRLLALAALTALAPALALAAEGSGSGSGYGGNEGGPSGSTGTPMLGVKTSPPSAEKAADQNIPPNQGVQIQEVYDGSAAAEMGLKPGDIITQLNGQSVSSMQQFRNIIQQGLVGEAVEVSFSREGQAEKRVGFLGQWPETIPMNPIDSSAEQRYRQMQEQSLQRRRGEINERQRLGDELERSNQSLQRQAAAQQRFQEASNDPASATHDRPAAAAAGLARVYDRALVHRDPLRAAALPWVLSYRLTVDDPVDDGETAASASDGPAAAAPLALPPATVPMVFRYRCEVAL
jgi:membrane-associated protease RseP (regulator of RpoE activity)